MSNVRASRFFNRYRKLVDVDYYNKDSEGYKTYLNKVYKLTSEIDYSSNVLVIHESSIYKEVFLSGFSRLPKYVSYRYLNISDIVNISFMVPDDAYTDVNSYGGIISTSQLVENVLCLTLNCHESPNKMHATLCNETVINRTEGSLRDVGPKPKYNWIFYMGNLDSLKTQYNLVYNLFTSSNQVKFGIYDLNKSKKKVELLLPKVSKDTNLFDL